MSRERKVSFISGNDLDENGIGNAVARGFLARITECRTGSDDLPFVRRQRNPARWIGLEKIGEIRGQKLSLSGFRLHGSLPIVAPCSGVSRARMTRAYRQSLR